MKKAIDSANPPRTVTRLLLCDFDSLSLCISDAGLVTFRSVWAKLRAIGGALVSTSVSRIRKSAVNRPSLVDQIQRTLTPARKSSTAARLRCS
jgi:hypothetical protein